jgi:hypothetical protein
MATASASNEAMAQPSIQATPPSPSTMAKEVDYYLNPTELFRWINYRRWDGAKSRAISHPEECSTWIVSRHNTDGRILWRHLPLHLICMQKEAACSVSDGGDITAVLATRQMEHLMDVLLDAYPEGASSPDDQGMLPLHLLLNKAEGEPNERCINLLLASFPNAVDIRDKFGRTPNDLLRESSQSGGMQTSDRCLAAFRALKRARHVTDKITATIRSESASIVSQVKHESSNERSASQQIIVRLEEELSRCRHEIDARDDRERDVRQDIQSTKNELVNMKSRLKDVVKDLEVTRKERDELLSANVSLRSKSGGHDEIIERIRQEADENRQTDLETIANLKSEVSTSKAVMEALESQLRSRFTNEDYLSTTVSDLEEQLEELKVRHEHAVKKHQHEMDALAADNKKLKWNSDELTKKNAHLYDKLTELNKQMSSIISSYSTLNSEHDRLLELSQAYESNLLDSIRSERSKIVEHFNKQRTTLDKSFLEQERIIEESLKCQDKLIANVSSERSRGKGTVEKLRNEFQQLRAAAAERERMIHLEELAASRRTKRISDNGESKTLTAPSTSSSSSESRNPHPSRSHHRPSRPSPLHSTNASVSTSDGHLVRLLDERAAAQSTPKRVIIPAHSMSISSTVNSSAQPMPRSRVPLPRNYSGGQYPLQGPSGREGERGRGGPMIDQGISKSASNATYASRPGDLYSLEQYSNDASDASSLYSKSSRTTYTDGSEPPYHFQQQDEQHMQQQQHRQQQQQQQQHQQHSWRQNDYRRNLPHVNESNSYDGSAQE